MCGSLRSPPECSKQRIPAVTPHAGHGTARNIAAIRSLILIQTSDPGIFRKTVRFGTLLQTSWPAGPQAERRSSVASTAEWLETVAKRWAGMPPAPFLPGGFELLREKNEWRSALVFSRCTRIPSGEAELQQLGIIHRAEVCAESIKVEGARLKHRVLLGERLKEG
jgi:hypothetical protein